MKDLPWGDTVILFHLSSMNQKPIWKYSLKRGEIDRCIDRCLDFGWVRERV
jgi:hypothetical protein